MNGEITQHLSPNEINFVGSLFRDAHSKIFARVRHFLFQAAPGLGAGLLLYWWMEREHEHLAHKHRD